jgi:hypothetical protein
MWCICGPKRVTGDEKTEEDRFIVRALATPRVSPRSHARRRFTARLPRTRVSDDPITFLGRQFWFVPTRADQLHRLSLLFLDPQRMGHSQRSLALNDNRLIVYGACMIPPRRALA